MDIFINHLLQMGIFMNHVLQMDIFINRVLQMDNFINHVQVYSKRVKERNGFEGNRMWTDLMEQTLLKEGKCKEFYSK